MANAPRDLVAREIDEELRREQLLKLWDKYGIYLLAAVLIVVVGIGGWRYYQYRSAQIAEDASNRYIVALGEFARNQTLDAQKRLEALAADAPAGYAALARLRLAANDAAQGNTIGALETYEQIATDETVDPILQDLARLQIAMLKFDSVPFSELRNQLRPLASDRSPWRYSARELLGMGAMKAGFEPEARTYFKRLLADRTTPAGISERVRVMVAMLNDAGRAKGAPAEAPADTPGAAGAEQKPETPAKADPAAGEAKAGSGKTE